MDERAKQEESSTSQIEQLQRERDELRKDIEQLCMQQAGPSYLAVATRMHFQRTAGLEQEIESLKKKLAVVTRDKQNLQEELSEIYRIKSQLADLHSAELLKNKEAEKQVKFFQSCVAAAFAERDHSLMESERAKECEEAMSQKLIDSERRAEEFQSALLDEKKLTAALKAELEELKEQNESFDKIVNKFYEIREGATGFLGYKTWQDRCVCLLDDPSDNWIFSADGETSTLKYIASLEEELEALRTSMDKLQNNMRMGLEIEQHLQRNVKTLEKKQVTLDNIIRNGLSTLHDFHSQHRVEILKLLDEETTQLESMFVEVEKMIGKIQISNQLKFESVQKEKKSDDIECRDVHITSDVDSSVSAKTDGLDTLTFAAKKLPDVSDALSQALQEKVAALLLLSQQEERHLLERDMNKALQKKVEELQRNLTRVTNEKVKALLELAQLKQQYQLSPENSGRFSDRTAVREQEGKLRNLLKRTYLKRWIGKDLGETETGFEGNHYFIDFARLKVENAALQEGMTNLEHVTSSTHRLRLSLLKAQEAATSTSAIAIETVIEALDGIIAEANQVKTALGGSLPVSWAADAADAASLYGSLYEPIEPSSGTLKTEKVDPVSAAGLEMMGLLIIAAQLLKHSTVRSASSEDSDSNIPKSECSMGTGQSETQV